MLIVDDDELIRRGIAAVISDEPDFCVCGFAGDESTAVKLLELQQPDLLLLDLSLGHRDGLLFLKDIAGRFADTQIITVSDEQHRGYGQRTLELGAAGYLAKDTSAVQLIATMRAVVAGGKGTRGRRSSVQGALRTAGKATRGVASLTDRELHVFRLIGEGLGTSRIAQELGLSRKTIETYREHIKLNSFTQTQRLYSKARSTGPITLQADHWIRQKIGETPDSHLIMRPTTLQQFQSEHSNTPHEPNYRQTAPLPMNIRFRSLHLRFLETFINRSRRPQ